MTRKYTPAGVIKVLPSFVWNFNSNCSDREWASKPELKLQNVLAHFYLFGTYTA